MNNLLLMTDSYKASHWLQYPEGTEYVFSYIESRGGKHDKVLFFGLQIFIQEYLMKPITQENIDEATEFFAMHGEPFNKEGWEYILNTYEGFLPVEIKAVPEGTILPVKNALVTIQNTDPKCFWLPSYLETMLLRAVWYPTTVATNSYNIKKIIKQYLEETGDVNELPFKLHDFGARGASSNETAGIGGAAHLVNFKGSDTVMGALFARKYYGEQMAGFSIPAAEHSTITSYGREGEVDAYRNMIKQFAKPGAIFAVVSDSYNIFNAVENIWGEQLKTEVINSGATLVIRPDSGDPVDICTWIVQRLDDKYGSVVNSKGYKVLNNVRIIQGDGVTANVIEAVLQSCKTLGFSASNIAFGQGGALLQGVNRDDQKFAMKCSAIFVNGAWRDVYKDPVTDQGKQSKRGIQYVYATANKQVFTTSDMFEVTEQYEMLLQPVYVCWQNVTSKEVEVYVSTIKWSEVLENTNQEYN